MVIGSVSHSDPVHARILERLDALPPGVRARAEIEILDLLARIDAEGNGTLPPAAQDGPVEAVRRNSASTTPG